MLSCGSTRQAFIGQSTAESELLGYTEGLQCGESVASLLTVFSFDVQRKLIGDCKSALAQLTQDTGSWRTRHLRIRSAKLRESIQDPAGQWSAEHCEGSKLVADGLTKPLQGGAFTRFVELLGMSRESSFPSLKKISKSEDVAFPHEKSCNLLVAGAALMQSSQWVVGALLIAVGSVMLWKDEQKKSKDRNKTAINGVKVGWSGTAYGKDLTGTVHPVTGYHQVKGSKSPSLPSEDVAFPRALNHQYPESFGGNSFWETPRMCAIRKGKAALAPPCENLEEALRRLNLNEEIPEHPQEPNVAGSEPAASSTTTGRGPQVRTTSAETPGLPSDLEKPWTDPRFQVPPTGSKDSWDCSLLRQGWLIRRHPKVRKRLFHPIHGKVPIDAAMLTHQRVTVRFLGQQEPVHHHHDEWLGTQRTSDDLEWRGYTFFQCDPSASPPDDSFELLT